MVRHVCGLLRIIYYTDETIIIYATPLFVRHQLMKCELIMVGLIERR